MAISANMTAALQALPGSRFLRNCAASLVTLSGAALLGALWFRDLDGTALLDALIGSVYLFIGIGLYGQSRFTLFLAIGVPAANLWYLSGQGVAPEALLQLRMLADLMVILCSGWVLWRVLRNPGT